MAKVTSPLMSLDASGSIGGTIVFSKWKVRNYVRQLVTPSNPKSPAQRARRAIMAFLAQTWRYIGATPQSSWIPAGSAGSYSPFNAFTSHNTNAWTDGKAPTETANTLPTGSPTTSPTCTATLTGRAALIAFTSPAGEAPRWGTALLRTANTPAPSFPGDCIKIFPTVSGANNYSYVDPQLAAGTYQYSTRSFQIDGTLDNTAAATTLVVA